MKSFNKFLSKNPLVFLLLSLPLTFAAQLLQWSSIAIFILAAIGIIPLAAYIGEATEDLASYTGPRWGALLNATLGNAAELIITITAVQAGLLGLVLASITGSIIGNLLLVLGFSIVVGGIRHGTQTFNKVNASRNAILLVLAVVTLIIPSMFSQSIVGKAADSKVEALSIGVAWTLAQAITILALATIGVVYLSEALVRVAEDVIANLGISEFFLGIILVPLIGNVAEHLVAVQMAHKNKMDLSVEIAISSSLQIALFVAPLLVFISLALGNPMHLIFNQFELLALMAAVVISALVSYDGESTWLEGAGLLSIYLILGLAFFLLP
ncbi:MAG: cation transporter [Chloroflexi bacterium]|nr:cation transporter [Chloroflexota bacterium]